VQLPVTAHTLTAVLPLWTRVCVAKGGQKNGPDKRFRVTLFFFLGGNREYIRTEHNSGYRVY
jgi:hypothetical protein